MRQPTWIWVSVLVSSCGLDNVNYLNNPDVQPQTDQAIVSWKYNPSQYNGTNFLGYEVFYKYYVEAVGTDYGINDLNALKTAGGVSVVPTPERLLSLGYHRANLAALSLNPEPLILLSAADLTKTLLFEIDFKNLINAPLTVKEDNPPVVRIIDLGTSTTLATFEIRRGVRNPSNTDFRRFWEVYSQTLRSQQPNLEPSLATALGGNPPAIWVVLFVMAYGWSPEGGREISEPVLLGTIKSFTLDW